ncbi:MAG TPA: carboxypeptidase-like regulatory domain-containing protein, partial [Flavisolibacter sp.]|nr:carboxypeptidase-like regulatory domain-containing protein [Flavisolibacter sp.]
TINGYITDSASGERLQGATIAAINQGLGTTSNAYGFYSLTLPEAPAELIVNVVGYEPALQTIILTGDTVMAFQLAPVTTTLSSVEVAATRTRKLPIQQSTQMSMVDLPMETIASMPKLLGETDVFRSLQFLPGVMAGNEVSSGLYVRGGSPDQNLILLDGVPVYNASHLFGLFSVFNADALQSVQLFKGGFPARYGGRLSSVIDLRMKE